MSLIPDDVIEQVREAADIVGIVGEFVQLKRTGSDFRGPCPFHGGTHRNLAVIPKKQMFYCFVCHEGGDVFTFLMKKAGMDYPTAVRDVARRVGITIPEQGPTGPDPREPLFAAVAAAAEWYAKQLRESDEAQRARDYLASRGITLETAGVLGLGYAPASRGFGDAMKRLGVRTPVLLEAGLLVKRDDGSVRARFRNRLLFPIHDLRGRPVAFGGRILGPGEPKYLNSPESPVFQKGKLLYHLHTAKQAIRRAERAILVEGYFDVLRPALAGVEEVVAPLGTGLTADQAALLARYTKHVILLYDSDEAGLRATFRAGDVLLSHSLRVSVATLPEGEDPDTVVTRGGAPGLEAVLRDAVDLLERKIQIVERRGLFATLPGRRRALDRLLPTIRAARDPITRELYLTRTAEVAGVRKDVLEREAGGGASPAETSPVLSRPLPPATVPAFERHLLHLLLDPSWRARVTEAVSPSDFESPVHRAAFDAVVADAPERLDEVAAQVLEALRGEAVPGDADQVFDEAVRRLEARRFDREIAQIDGRIPLARGAEQDALVREKLRLTAERNKRVPKYAITTRRSGASGS